jgi:N-acetyl sugar amidotransferase
MTYVTDPTLPMFSTVTYCTRCGFPSTEEGNDFDRLGVCKACRSSEQKMRIDWAAKERELAALFERYRGKGESGYDCIVPISGGKDSAYQLYLVTEVYGLKPLAVTFSHAWFTETGRRNLAWCLETFKVDHVMAEPERDVVNRCARRSLEVIGDACWHCHAGVGAYPLRVAVERRIPLLVWGESAAEGSGQATYEDLIAFDRDYFITISAKVEAEDFACADLPLADLAPFRFPTQAALDAVGVVGIHIGNYIFWDHEAQTEFLRDRYGWREASVEGTYKCYKSVECIMPGVHDFTKFLKRGFGRATDHVAQDVRAGLMTLEEGQRLIRAHDPVEPGVLGHYLAITGRTREEFFAIMDAHRERLGAIPRADMDAALKAARRA